MPGAARRAAANVATARMLGIDGASRDVRLSSPSCQPAGRATHTACPEHRSSGEVAPVAAIAATTTAARAAPRAPIARRRRATMQ